ncbi:1-aminocyclopropane-1-carboxylate oxidase homolog 1 [Neltuma alba]|uniref:1-aminocyclopropane-1-carboxylate oxidase homolog 1 n=1 Tax=Neltuma alba TaxID=207710 RepID=UPI0010A2CC5D|nr:1-aminocyclopropane-1-carboxylate oxidase homolog 1-like [Prosopis alba]
MGSSNTYDRLQELKAFDESKSGVKGVVESGITKIPRIFIRPPEEIAGDEGLGSERGQTQFEIPVIDLKDIVATGGDHADDDVVGKVRCAAETVGFFQVVNHGIPMKLLQEMLAAARVFHELPKEVKMEYYTREEKRRVKFSSNFDLYQSKYANWRDTLFCVMAPEPLDPQELPLVCRDVTMEYSKQIAALGNVLFELLSESLGLKADYLKSMDCAKGHCLLSHYYPPCPQPELTMGTTKHSDPDFLTILLQDHIGGLQVLCHNQWIDVPPLPGALVVNIGDLLQLMSNDRLKSVEHRVLANVEGPRVSVACFFTLHTHPTTRTYGPIKELLSPHKPPLYSHTSLQDFIAYYDNKGLDGYSALSHFKL